MCNNTNTYYFLLSFYGVYIPVLIIMTCVYFKILHVAVTQIRKIKKHDVVQGSVKPSPLQQQKLLLGSEARKISVAQKVGLYLKKKSTKRY